MVLHIGNFNQSWSYTFTVVKHLSGHFTGISSDAFVSPPNMYCMYSFVLFQKILSVYIQLTLKKP